MGGNALNREAAAACLASAESVIEDICAACTKAAKAVYVMNEGYAGASSGDTVTQVYASYLTKIRQMADSFGKDLMPIHQNLLKVINSGADSDYQNVRIDYHIASGMAPEGDGSYGGLIFNKEMAGIKDFETTSNDIINFNSAIQEIVESTNPLILQYKSLWELGNRSKNEVLKEAAHNAAEAVRGYVKFFEEGMREQNKTFMDDMQKQYEYHTSMGETVEGSIDALKQSFNNLSFEVLQA